jgi:glycerophosphoryl diester phosphodiesterase
MLVLGHRGASATFPENTVPAFRGALDLGADGVELDVRRTADGGTAVRHDAELPDGRRIVDVRSAELPAEVPQLPEVLDACAGAEVVNVEIKNWPADVDFDPAEQLVELVVTLLDERGQLADEHLLVTSFHAPTVDRVRALAPTLPTGFLVINADEPEALVARVADAGHRALHPHHLFVTEDLVELAHAAGLALNTWTVDDPDRIRWLRDIGVDAVIVNDPLAALRALGRAA